MNTFSRFAAFGVVLIGLVFSFPVNPAAAAEEGKNENASYEVQGSFGDKAGMHNNAKTGHNAEYDFDHPNLPTDSYRFTGDLQMGEKIEGTHQNALQGMVRGSNGGRLLTQTGLLSPGPGPSFAGPADMGFKKDSVGGFYQTMYQTQSSGGRFLPGTGTGELAINILDEEQFPKGDFVNVSPASRNDTLRAYLAAGGKLSRGSISEEEESQLNVTKTDYYEQSDY